MLAKWPQLVIRPQHDATCQHDKHVNMTRHDVTCQHEKHVNTTNISAWQTPFQMFSSSKWTPSHFRFYFALICWVFFTRERVTSAYRHKLFNFKLRVSLTGSIEILLNIQNISSTILWQCARILWWKKCVSSWSNSTKWQICSHWLNVQVHCWKRMALRFQRWVLRKTHTLTITWWRKLAPRLGWPPAEKKL